MGVLDVEETLIPWAIVLQELALMVKPWNRLTLNQSRPHRSLVLASVVDVELTLPEIVTQEQTPMAAPCDLMFNIM